MPVCYRKVGKRYYSPSEYKRLKKSSTRSYRMRTKRMKKKDGKYQNPHGFWPLGD